MSRRAYNACMGQVIIHTSRFAEMTAFRQVFWSIRVQITYLRHRMLPGLGTWHNCASYVSNARQDSIMRHEPLQRTDAMGSRLSSKTLGN
jgi:hypothetical protein